MPPKNSSRGMSMHCMFFSGCFVVLCFSVILQLGPVSETLPERTRVVSITKNEGAAAARGNEVKVQALGASTPRGVPEPGKTIHNIPGSPSGSMGGGGGAEKVTNVEAETGGKLTPQSTAVEATGKGVGGTGEAETKEQGGKASEGGTEEGVKASEKGEEAKEKQGEGTEGKPWVGRPSPLWKGPNEILIKAWKESQEKGTKSGRMAKYLGAGGMANTFNGLLRFAFESIYNTVFRMEADGGWDASKISMQAFPSIGGAKKNTMVDWCYTIKSQPGKVLSTLDPAQGVDLPYATGPSVYYHTNCPLYKHWSRNPKLEAKFLELGLITKESQLPYSFQIAHQMIRFIAQPQDDVAKIVRETFETEKTKGVALVGVQVRMGGAAIGDKVEFGPSDMTWAKYFITCAQNVSKLITDGRKVKYYISADRMDTHKLAADMLGAENIISPVKQPKHTDRGNHQREAAIQAALDSIFMGMYVEQLVFTPGSTFGALAAMAMGRNPHHVEVEEGPRQFQCTLTDIQNAPPRYKLPGSAPLR